MKVEISIIIPVFEQWGFVPELVGCLRAQSYSMQGVEILLIDNGSRELSVPDNLPENVKVLHCDVRGAYAARNHGIRNSQGQLLIFTDADCLPVDNWLNEVKGALRSAKTDDVLIAGRVDSISEWSEPSAYEIFDMVRGIPQAHYVSRGYAATANLSVPRKLFDEIGLFDEKLFSGGDAEFCRRATNSGFRIIYKDSAVVRHRTRASWDEIATKARRVKGGQLTCKSKRHKLWIYVRTILSPGITAVRLFRHRKFSLRYRLIASLVYLRVWCVELLEMIRVSFGAEPERR
ncbi:glycosyltransferase family 2 protein [Microbulbifer sediminum]|uniref:glycosyltransferase family 2 protein n=1 Tax=Microbulbifer sediminum TaxID=2904250 RepID=UPI001F3DB8E3|nr:glycosyltransferase [Microbulbifer sediminum]